MRMQGCPRRCGATPAVAGESGAEEIGGGHAAEDVAEAVVAIGEGGDRRLAGIPLLGHLPHRPTHAPPLLLLPLPLASSPPRTPRSLLVQWCHAPYQSRTELARDAPN